ncbi:MAG: zinc metallopeptidase [Planctomycetota bacterium]|nr:MAG: zinc metallopeptidase [Planctomycetota bacterium]
MLTNPLLLVGFLAVTALALWAQFAVKSTFARYAKVPARAGLTGAEVAHFVLEAGGAQGVKVEAVHGFLSDHYDPRRKVLRLSPEVYSGRTVAAFGVAAHEAGHAIQHAHRYAALTFRNMVVPTASLGSSLGIPLILIGLLFQITSLAIAGLVFFALVVFFQLLTLPVEFDASRRAVQVLSGRGLIQSPEEEKGVKAVLTAAALTYVAAAVAAVFWLLYYGSLVLGGRRNN